jgi:outer membrane lipoprotein SlyB
MMKSPACRRAGPVILIASALLVSACENAPIDRRTQGQIVGGVAGAALGATIGGGTGQLVATGAGAVLGTIVGGAVAER